MAANLFKTRWVPNADGTDSTTAITNTNATFSHTYLGDDLTGDGTREFPFKTVNKADQKSGVSYIVFRGVVNEYFNLTKPLIGDDINQTLIINNYHPSISWDKLILKATCDILNPNSHLILVTNQTTFTNGISGASLVNILAPNITITDEPGSWGASLPTQSIIGGYIFNIGYASNAIVIGNNNIVLNLLNAQNSPATFWGFKYSIFLSSCVFKFNGTLLTSPIWTNDPKANVGLIRNAYIAAGMTAANANNLFSIDPFGNETCQIVWEQRNGGTLPNIFNGYNADGTVSDFTLNPDLHNVALWASDIGGYVGCFKPTETIPMTDTIINVNADGTDDTVAGTLLQLSGGNLVFNNLSSQTWNRMRASTPVYIPNGSKLEGSTAMTQDGTPFGNYIGKLQSLIDTTVVNPGDTLTVGNWYKVFNDSSKDITNAILYNGVQYLPEYTFHCITGVTTFSLLNTGTGTYCKKIIADPMESIELIPYDTPTVRSAFPMFSAPLMGVVKLLYYTAAGATRYGTVSGAPLLFGDLVQANFAVDFPTLANNKIAYYNTFAISNADQEFVTLSVNTTNFTVATPTLNYVLTEVNAHIDQPYDY